MKFVFFGYDFLYDTVTQLLEEGHEMLALFTFACDNVFNFNTRVLDLARAQGAMIFETKPTLVQIDDLTERGAEIFIAGGYPHKIPVPDEARAYAVNIHPSYLPRGRGLMPTPQIMMGAYEAAGFTIHKLTDEFDAGDILYQEKFTITPHDTVETYSARVAMHVPDALSKIMAQPKLFWDSAQPQNYLHAETFDPPTDEMRTFNWNKPLEENLKIARAFGRYGTIARSGEYVFISYDVSGWHENHGNRPGDIVLQMSREIIIAVDDGFLCLKDVHLAQEEPAA